jgi:uncharacterized membrane protein
MLKIESPLKKLLLLKINYVVVLVSWVMIVGACFSHLAHLFHVWEQDVDEKVQQTRKQNIVVGKPPPNKSIIPMGMC